MLLVYFLAAVVFPLIITPGLLFHFDIAPKVLILSLAAALSLVRIPRLRAELEALSSRTPGKWFIILAVAQTAWFLVATILSSRPWFSLFGSGWRRFGLVETISLLVVAIFAAGGLCLRRDGMRIALRMIVIAGFLASIYGIFEYFGIDPLQPVAAYQAHAGDSIIVRPPGTLGHADYFGWWLAIEFFCALALLRMETSHWKHLAKAAVVFILVAVVLSGTRAALLAIVTGGIAMFVMSPLRITRKHIAALACALVVFAVFVISPAGKLLRARVVWSGDEPAGGARPLLWRDSLGMSAARPLAGFGPETYLSAFAPYQSEALSRQFPDYHHESPHNLALDSLTAMGVPGFLLVGAWALLAWFATATALRASSRIAAPLGAALIAAATAAMFSAASPGPVLLSTLLIGILIAEGPSETNTARLPNRFAIPGAIIAATVAAGLTAFGAIQTDYEFRLQRFTLHPDEAAYQSMLAVSLPGAADDLYASRKLQLECQKRTNLSAYVGCVQQTLQAAARALRTDDDIANAWYNLAMLNAGQRNIIGTRQGLMEASRVSPNWFKPHWTLARLFSQTGRNQEAKAQAIRAAYLDSNRDPEVVETLSQLTHSQLTHN